jgi:holo-[acyl-carrier protein] synthase
MITGIGIDSIEIARVREKCSAPDSPFMRRMYTELELARAMKRYNPYEHLAACFAAREAFFKATQVWYDRQRVSVAQRESGEPYYVLAAEITAKLAGRRVLLSLSHDCTCAHAFCIAESG